MKVNAVGEFEKQKHDGTAAIDKEKEANQKAVEQTKSKLPEWRKLKQIEEQEIYNVANPFIDDNQVTLS